MNGYNIFLMIELGKSVGLIDSKMEYDLMWNKGCELYEEFTNSKFDCEMKSEYDCILDFLHSIKPDFDDWWFNQGGFEITETMYGEEADKNAPKVDNAYSDELERLARENNLHLKYIKIK